jgi:hypothetical protein
MAEWLCTGLQIRRSISARVVKLVDTRDLKSLARKSVPVQVRPRAPFPLILKGFMVGLTQPAILHTPNISLFDCFSTRL